MAGVQRLPPTGGRGRDGPEQTEPVDVSRPTSQLLDLSGPGDETRQRAVVATPAVLDGLHRRCLGIAPIPTDDMGRKSA